MTPDDRILIAMCLVELRRTVTDRRSVKDCIAACEAALVQPLEQGIGVSAIVSQILNDYPRLKADYAKVRTELESLKK